MKAAPVAFLAFLSCQVFGQSAAEVQVGVCIDPDRLEAAQAAGFDYVELGVTRVAGLTDVAFRELISRVGQLRIPVAAANTFLPGNLKIVGPSIDRERQMEYVAKALSRMKQLGVSLIVLGSGGARRVPEGFSHEEALAQMADFCRRIAPLAGDAGITIAIEPLRHQETNLINTTRQGLDFVKAVDSPQIRLLVDYYHLAEEGESPQILIEAGGTIVHTHIANPKGRVYPLSPDESDYAGFFECLCRIGYAGRISIEASTPDFSAQAPRSIETIRSGLLCRGK